MNHPNIFTYATSELSQDAFICWLIKWLDHEESTDMHLAAKQFIVLLFNKGSKTKVSTNDIGKLITLNQQLFKTDIFFTVKINNEEINFIIEDKTETFSHSNQLQKYQDTISKSKKYGGDPKKPLICIYYKTGHIYTKDIDDCKKPKNEFHIIDCQIILEFLSGIETENTIFNDYLDYIKEKYEHRKNILSKLSCPNGHLELKWSFFQYEFIKNLSTLFPQTAGLNKINHSSSKGIPWTHYEFARVNINGGSDRILYRIERRKNKKYCITVRQYSKPKTPQEKLLKLERLKELNHLFKDAITIPNGKLTIDTKISDKKGKNISDITVIYLGTTNELNTVNTCLPEIHSEFIKRLKPFELRS